MLSVNDLKQICQQAVAALPGLKTHLLIVGESHLSKRLAKLKAADSPFMVALYPSHLSDSKDEDALTWQNQLMFLILTKPQNYTMRTLEQEEADFAMTQDLAQGFIDHLLEARHAQGACNALRRLSSSGIEIDPEYNYYSCDGWSLTLNLRTHV